MWIYQNGTEMNKMIDKVLDLLFSHSEKFFWGYLLYLVVFGYEAPTSPDGAPLMLGIFKKSKRKTREPVTDIAAVKVDADQAVPAEGGGTSQYVTSRSYAEVVDLISEGPIEGLVSGEHDYTKNANITGYKTAKFIPYTATGVGGGTPMPELGFLQSVYWNEVPVVDKEGLYNFPSINVNYVKGQLTGSTPNLNTDLPGYGSFSGGVDANTIMDLSINRSVGERLYGPEIKGGDALPTKTQRAQLKGPVDKYAKTYTILNKECSQLIVNIKVSALFENIPTGKTSFKKRIPAVGRGDVKAKTIRYKIFLQPVFNQRFNTVDDSSSGVVKLNPSDDDWELAAEETVFGKIDEPYIRSTPIDFSDRGLSDKEGFEGWRIRILRITPDSLTSYLRNVSFVDSLVEVYGTKLRYPYSSMVYSQFDARSFSRIPSRAYDTKLLKVKVPNNYNPILKSYGDSSQVPTSASDYLYGIAKGAATNSTYNATTKTWTRSNENGTVMWDGNFGHEKLWTDNPAWCFYDLITNPLYGLGDYINASEVDKWVLYEIAKYCDEMVDDTYGGFEPRFTINYVINSREEAFKVLNDLSSIFRGISYYTNGSIFAVQDNLKSPSYQFNNSNVVDGSFSFASSSKKARHTVAIVRYNDKKNWFQPAVEYMEDEEGVRRYGIRELETTALGCTSRGQARRFAKWILASETTETETVSFAAGSDGAYLKPGDIVSVYDNSRNPLKYSGRTNIVRPLIETAVPGATVKSNSAYNSMVIDQALNFTAGTKYKLSLLTPTYDYDTVDSNMDDSNDVLRRSQLQNLIFDGGHTFTGIGTPGTFRSDLLISGSGVCTEIYFYTGTNTDPAEIYGGKANQLDFKNYVITGYTNTAVTNTSDPRQTTTIDYSGGYYSGENLIWSVEPLLEDDPNFVNNHSSSYRVINIKEEDEGTYSVSALLYSTGKYDDIDTVSASTVDPTKFIPYFPAADVFGLNSSSDLQGDFVTNYPRQTYVPGTNIDNEIKNNHQLLEVERDRPSVGKNSTEEDRLLTTLKINFSAAGYSNMIEIADEGRQVQLYRRTADDNLVNFSDNISYSVNVITTGDPQITQDWSNNGARNVPTEGITYLVAPETYSDIKQNQVKVITSDEASLYFNKTVDNEQSIIGERVEFEVLVAKDTDDYYIVIYPVSNEGTIGHGLLSRIDPIESKEEQLNSPVQTIGISHLKEANTDVTPIGDVGSDGTYREYLSEDEIPSFSWQVSAQDLIFNRPAGDPSPEEGNFGRYNLLYVNDDLTYRLTLRKPSIPNERNIPNNYIYIEYTGYASYGSAPNFTLLDEVNTPALMDTLREGTYPATNGEPNAEGHEKHVINADTTYYKIPSSGIVIRDGDYLPLRNFDLTVEAQDQNGNTSARNKIFNNTIRVENDTVVGENFNQQVINSNYDITEVNVQNPSGTFFAQKKNQSSTSVRYLSNKDAASQNYPYMAQARFLPDDDGVIRVTMKEVVQSDGDPTVTEEEAEKFFNNAQGVVYYYTTGNGSTSPAPEFVVNIRQQGDDEKFKIQQDAAVNLNNINKVSGPSSDTTAFNGVVQNLPNLAAGKNLTVYRGYQLFGDDEDTDDFTIPLSAQVTSNPDEKVQTINISFAFFDNLSKRRAFVVDDDQDLDIPIFLNNGNSPKIFTDVDVNFSTSVDSISSKYTVEGVENGTFLNTAGSSIFLKEYQPQTAAAKSTAFAGWAELNIGTTREEALKFTKKVAFWKSPYNTNRGGTSQSPTLPKWTFLQASRGASFGASNGDDGNFLRQSPLIKLNLNFASVLEVAQNIPQPGDPLILAGKYDDPDGSFAAGIVNTNDVEVYVQGQSRLAMTQGFNGNLEGWNEPSSSVSVEMSKMFYRRVFLVRVKFAGATLEKHRYTVLPDIVSPMFDSGGPSATSFLGALNSNGLNRDNQVSQLYSVPDTSFEIVKYSDSNGMSNGFDLWIFQNAGHSRQASANKKGKETTPEIIPEERFPTVDQVLAGGGLRIKFAIVNKED